MVLAKKESYADHFKALEKKYYQHAELDMEMFICNPARGSSVIAY